MFFQDGPEYKARLNKPFTPPTVTLKELHNAVPKHLLKKSDTKATFYLIRDITFSILLYEFAFNIAPWAQGNFGGYISTGWQKILFQSILWMSYWWFQGMVMAGIFCLGHDAGHNSLFNNKTLNNIIGFILHSYILTPYFAWRSTHHAHHKATGSMERDENYVPYTRDKYKLPAEGEATPFDYAEVFQETPIYSLYRVFIMQAFGWWLYLAENAMGSPMYPPGTNHFDPNSPLFKPEQRNSIILSDVGLIAMLFGLLYLGPGFVLRYYLIPYLFVNHWIVMFTYLHHSDPTIPHYRRKEWSFLRGAVATVDRPILGWMGRFFFHNISHDHVAHHLFIRAPFYNGPAITKAIKPILKDDYCYDSSNTFYALYRSFTQCVFVENEGDIVFYKNSEGKAVRQLLESTVKEIEASGWTPEEQDKLEGDAKED